MEHVGKNTVSGRKIMQFIERVEALNKEAEALADDRKAVFAEAKAAGFTPRRLREIIKIRKQKPHDRMEAQQELDMYLHAIGMDATPPLFAAVGAMGVDLAVREQVIDALKQLVPPSGEVTFNAGGKPVRLWRDHDGEVQVADIMPEPSVPDSTSSQPTARQPSAPVPVCDDAGAAELGRQAFRGNQPITVNPFPFGDKRRPVWDEAWRSESGTDGMGPNEDD